MHDQLQNGRLLKQVNDAVEKYANNQLRREDLTMVQSYILLTLQEKPDRCCSFKELEQILGVAQSTCAGLVSRLASKGLVNSFTDPADRRMKLVRLTEEGAACCRQVDASAEQLESHLFQGFTPQEKQAFHDLLLKLYHNVK